MFVGHATRSSIRGTVRQGSARGSFLLTRGTNSALFMRGVFTAGNRTFSVVDDPYGPPRLLDDDTGEVHGLFGSAIGSGFATRDPVGGAVRLGVNGGTIAGALATRVPVRQLEVRFKSGNATLAGTLTIPPGTGPHPAVAFVQGSGATQRAYLPDLDALLLHQGIAVLAYDKRGIAQSSGIYPGEAPDATTIDVLARDAEAAVRFLRAQPEIDATRVGLAGHSQGGWIVPLAATREPAVKFAVIFSGPAVTAYENDTYEHLAGEGDFPQQLSDAEVDAATLRDPGGVDPIPWIRAMSIPALWLYGGLDKTVPSRLSVQRLAPIAAEAGRDFTIEWFPRANHALVETQTGLTSEMLRSDTFAPGMFAAVSAWLRAHHLTR